MPAKPQKERSEWVLHHQCSRNFVLAEKLIVPILPAPVAWWSHLQTCDEVGHGIWLAKGSVGLLDASGEEISSDWIAVFTPGNPQPLYLRLGPHEVGNLAHALGLAGITAPNH